MLKNNFRSYLVWFLASLFYGYQLILRTLPVITENEIKQIFEISDFAFGQIRGVYYLGYTFIHLPMAYLLDRFGPKKVIPLSIILAVTALLPMTLSTSFMWLLLGRIALGVGSAAGILGVFKVIRLYFPEDHFSRMMGMTASIGLLGALFGMGPLKQIFSLFGYFEVLYCLMGAGLLLSAIVYILLPKDTNMISENFFVEIYELMTNKQFLFIVVIGGLLVGSLEGFADGVAANYLTSLYNISNEYAVYIASLIPLGFVIGSPILAHIGDVTRSHQKIMGLSGLYTALCFIALWLSTLFIPSLIIVQIIYFIIGVFCAYQVFAIYLAGRVVPSHLVGISGAGANMTIMSFGYLFHSVIGFLLNGTQKIDALGRCVYPFDALVFSTAIIPIAAIIGWIGLNWVSKQLRES